jgi:hypothetical protein
MSRALSNTQQARFIERKPTSRGFRRQIHGAHASNPESKVVLSQ